MIESAFAKVEKWSEEHGMIFDPDKFEAIHFSRKKAFSNPDIKLPPPCIAKTQYSRTSY